MNTVKSIPNKKITYCLRVVYFVLFTCSINIMIMLPITFYKSYQWLETYFLFFIILSFGLSTLICWYVFKVVSARILFKNQICSYSIDDFGFHYHLFSGRKRSILFSQLSHDSNRSHPDIYLVNYSNLPISLYVYLNTANTNIVIVEQLYFQLGGFLGEYIIKNSHELACEFFKRVRQQRPDITVSPEIYYQLNIHPEHFNFDHDVEHLKKRNRRWVFGIVTIFLIGVCLFIYHQYRFIHGG